MSARKRKQANKSRKRRRLFTIIGSLVFSVIIIGGLLFSAFAMVALATQDMPDITDPKFQTRAQTTKIYDRDGALITDFYVEQNRILVPLDKISKHLQNAVISIEDQRFYKHEGVDWKAIARALVADVQKGSVVQGGSTLTQQLVKNTLLTNETSMRRKIREAALAFQVEAKYSKEDILQSYLNTIYFGQSAYGAETAAETYFGKSAADLTVAEGALLAAVIRLPNVYDPYKNPVDAKTRRDLVIGTMLKQDLITKEEAKEAQASPIALHPPKQQNYPYPYFVEYVKQLMLTDSTFGSTVSERESKLFKGGLRIYTTIDPKMQGYAEDAVWSTLNRPEDPAGSLVSIEPSTGYIRAMVGGKDWQTQKFNYAVQALRQPGSAFKPFVLAAALENGISISKNYNAANTVIALPGDDWVVGGSGRGGTVNLRDATINSINPVFARLIMDVGPTKVVELVKKMGISSRVEAFPAIALGGLGEGVTPLEMATAYTTFANNGQHPAPIAITKVTDSSGKVLKENRVQMKPAMSPVTAYLVTDALKGVIQAGTGRAANIGRPAAGKTGTTEKNSDAWFVGFTPALSTAVWIGHPDGRRPMTSVHGVLVQGGNIPSQIWRSFMARALEGIPATDFARPPKGVVQVLLCKESGERATEFCPDTYWGTFAADGAPVGLCSMHKEAPQIDMPNIVGQPAADAKTLLEGAGFLVKITEIDTMAVQAGSVAVQVPMAGTKVSKGATIDMGVSTGRPAASKISIPRVVGMRREEGQALIEDAGLKHAVVWEPAKDDSEAGKIISQTPPAGQSAKPGDQIVLRVGRKP